MVDELHEPLKVTVVAGGRTLAQCLAQAKEHVHNTFGITRPPDHADQTGAPAFYDFLWRPDQSTSN